MGYSELNDDQFKIKFKSHDGSNGEKQIDVFAKDDETVVIIECKSRDSRGRRTLQKDLGETDSLQKPLANAIREYYGQEFKPKIIWIYVTKNIIWSEPDLERAAASNIRVITENEMHYFDAFIRHMGPAGRFQFLAEFLENQDIPELSNVKVPAIRGQLGGEQFYSFVTTPRHLLKIAFVNHQALNHPDKRPAYQRMIAPKRILEIESFIKKGGYFPTNILINFTEVCQFDLLTNKDNADPHIKFGLLHLPNKYKSAWIIDGQHRLYGYSNLDDEWLDQSLAVIAFEKMDTKVEADLFATINQKQKSVQRSVILSLQAELKWGSSDPKERLSALSSSLVKSFNADASSPFFQRLVLDGLTVTDNQSITLPEFVNGLTRSNLLGKVIQKSQLLVPSTLSGATDELTVLRARKILNAYFSIIRDANERRWEAGKAAYICTNPGIRGHLLLIACIFDYITFKFGKDLQALDEDNVMTFVGQVISPLIDYLKSANDTDIYDKFSKKFGEVGVTDYFYELCLVINEKIPEFGTVTFFERRAKQKDERITQTHQDVIKLCKDISDYVIAKLKDIYGTQVDSSGEKVWWEDGIENTKIKQAAYSKYQDALKESKEKRLPREAYLDLIDYKEIIRQKSNWPHFSNVFNIPLKNEKGKVYYLDWIDYLNKLRRVPAHPSEFRGYEEEDYEFIKHIKFQFYPKLDLAKGNNE